jgi:hypothetical protein
LLVDNTGVTTDTISVKTLEGDVALNGNMKVDGHLEVNSLHVNELTADVRQERSSSLTFDTQNGNSPIGKGLVWQDGDNAKSFILQTNPDRLWSSNTVDLHREANYSIDNVPVITATSLGETVLSSKLRSVGRLQGLTVDGDLNIDDFVFWDSGAMRMSIGTESPNGQLSISSEVTEFIVEPEYETVKVGTYSTSELKIITDNTTRIGISPYGHVTMGSAENTETKISMFGKVGIGVANPSANFEVAGPIKFEGKKFATGNDAPQDGLWKTGDIIWNNTPEAGGWIGWICVREGTPGLWKPFGNIEG